MKHSLKSLFITTVLILHKLFGAEVFDSADEGNEAATAVVAMPATTSAVISFEKKTANKTFRIPNIIEMIALFLPLEDMISFGNSSVYTFVAVRPIWNAFQGLNKIQA